jgi:hypothetical protein
MYNLIVNMYNSIKSCIGYNDNKSDFFSSEVGVRQGFNNNLYHNATLQTLSNAFSKSTPNAQYIFFFFFFIISKSHEYYTI